MSVHVNCHMECQTRQVTTWDFFLPLSIDSCMFIKWRQCLFVSTDIWNAENVNQQLEITFCYCQLTVAFAIISWQSTCWIRQLTFWWSNILSVSVVNWQVNCLSTGAYVSGRCCQVKGQLTCSLLSVVNIYCCQLTFNDTQHTVFWLSIDFNSNVCLSSDKSFPKFQYQICQTWSMLHWKH